MQTLLTAVTRLPVELNFTPPNKLVYITCNCRVITPEDQETGSVTVQVQPASASTSSMDAARVFSTPDSAMVMLHGSMAMLDLSFTATPTTVFQAGEQLL